MSYVYRMTINWPSWSSSEHSCFSANKVSFLAVKSHLKRSSSDTGNGLPCFSLRGSHLGTDCKWRSKNFMQRASSRSCSFSSLKSTCHAIGTLTEWRVAKGKRSGERRLIQRLRITGGLWWTNRYNWWIILAAVNETDFKEMKKVVEHCRKYHSSQSPK